MGVADGISCLIIQKLNVIRDKTAQTSQHTESQNQNHLG